MIMILPEMPVLNGVKRMIQHYTQPKVLLKEKNDASCKHFNKPTNKAIHDDNDDQGTTMPNRMLAIMMANSLILSKLRVKKKHRQTYSQRIGREFDIVLRPLNVNSQR